MKSTIIPLETGQYYHIYNRGINGTNIFFDEKNYNYFLSKYILYLSDYLDTYAYCLMKNHFHLLVRVKETAFENVTSKSNKGLHSPENIISKKFSDMFNSYTKSINKSKSRTGGLFETPFRRILVENEAYFTHLIWYIHNNPQKHGFVSDFREYPYSSYHSLLSSKPTKLAREDVSRWFGDAEKMIQFHNLQYSEKNFEKYIIEF